MNTLRETGYVICVILVITGIFMMLLPSGSTVKSVKFAIHLFLIISVISPVFNIKADFSTTAYEYDINENKAYNSLNELYNTEILKSFERELKLQAETVLKKYNILPQKIEILTNVNENQSIDITSVNITLKESDKNNCIKAIEEINNLFSVTSTVVFEGE